MARGGETGGDRAIPIPPIPIQPTRARTEPAYGPPRQPDYVSAGPGFPSPWGTAYAQPGAGGSGTGPAMPPRRIAPGSGEEMRPYAAPAPWSQRPGPGYGTGGLY